MNKIKQLINKYSFEIFLILIIIGMTIHFIKFEHYASKEQQKLLKEQEFLLKQRKQLKENYNKCQNNIQKLKEIIKQKSYNKEVMIKFIMKKNPKIYRSLALSITNNIIKYEKQYNLPTYIMLFLMDVESDFRVFIVSKSHAVGLCQINWKVWLNELKEKKIITNLRDLYDPERNINAGSYILAKYLNQYKSLKKGLQAYFGKVNGKTYFEKILKSAGEFYFMQAEDI